MPDVYEKADKFFVPKDFVNYKLTGEIATDPTEASGFYTYDAHKEAWSEELTEALQIDFNKLPQIVPSYSRLGVLKDEVAAILGLPKRIPVATGTAYFLCHHLSSGTNLPGQAMDLCGTSASLSVVVKKPLCNKNIQDVRHIADAWISFRILAGCAAGLFKDPLEAASKIAARVKKTFSPDPKKS